MQLVKGGLFIMNNQNINNLHNRKLDGCYFSITCIPTTIYLNGGDDIVKRKQIYIFYGTNLQGVRKYITSVISDNYSKTSDWYNLFMNLKQRNIETILYANIPDNKPLKDALSLSFKEIKIFISCFEIINKIFKYYSCSYTSNVFNVVKNIYLSNDIKDCNNAINIFYDEFSDSKFLIDIIEPYFKTIKSYYNYNFTLRHHIFSFYFYRDTYKKLSSFSKSKSFFLSLDEYINLISNLIKKTETRMYSSKSEWLKLINIIYDDNKDLIKGFL